MAGRISAFIAFLSFLILNFAPIQAEGADFSSPLPKGVIVFDELSYIHGKAKPGDIIRHEFRFVNMGGGYAAISRVETTCGCSTVESAIRSYAPGEEGRLEVFVDTTGMKGMAVKMIHVYFDNNIKEQIDLAIAAEMIE